MSEVERQEFAAHPYCEAAVALRRWDDAAKDPNLQTPSLEHFATYIDRLIGEKK